MSLGSTLEGWLAHTPSRDSQHITTGVRLQPRQTHGRHPHGGSRATRHSLLQYPPYGELRMVFRRGQPCGWKSRGKWGRLENAGLDQGFLLDLPTRRQKGNNRAHQTSSARFSEVKGSKRGRDPSRAGTCPPWKSGASCRRGSRRVAGGVSGWEAADEAGADCAAQKATASYGDWKGCCSVEGSSASTATSTRLMHRPKSTGFSQTQ